MPSEVVTWEACPGCAGTVALGWIGCTVTEIDCVAECRLTDAHRDAIRRAARPPVQGRPEGFGAPTWDAVGRTAFPRTCLTPGAHRYGDLPSGPGRE